MDNDNTTNGIDMEALADMIAAKMTKAPASPSKGEPSPSKGEASPSFDMDELVSKLHGVFENKGAEQSKQVYETLFTERLKTHEASAPGLSEYLDDKDEWGETRRDKIKGSDDFDTRMQKLDAVYTNYRRAQSKPDAKPVVTQKVREKLESQQNRYDDLNTKFKNGDINDRDYNEKFFDEVLNEIQSLAE